MATRCRLATRGGGEGARMGDGASGSMVEGGGGLDPGCCEVLQLSATPLRPHLFHLKVFLRPWGAQEEKVALMSGDTGLGKPCLRASWSSRPRSCCLV